MKRRSVDLRGGSAPILDIVSYGRGVGSGRFTKEQLELIARTVSRTPEVMVKVSGGARRLRGVEAHFRYISRQGSLELETDEGGVVRGKDGLKGLIRDWDLDIEVITPPTRGIKKPAKSPKLVHNLIFSMPAGTPADKVLKAVKKLAQEEWALKHRFAMVLHTDEPHPHVHVVLKARNEQGQRLNIRKATLREWRQQFAKRLREVGVSANSTERIVRGQRVPNLPDGLFRARRRGNLTNFTMGGGRATEPKWDESLAFAEQGWRNISRELSRIGQAALARRVQSFVSGTDASNRNRSRRTGETQRGTLTPSQDRELG